MGNNSGSILVIIGIFIVGVLAFFVVSSGTLDGFLSLGSSSNSNLVFRNVSNERITDGDIITSANPTNKSDKISFYVLMNKNTFDYSFEFDVVNNDSNDVVINNFTLDGYTDKISKYLNYTVESRDGTTIVKDTIEAGSTKHYVLKLTGNSDITTDVLNFKLGAEAEAIS